MKYSKIAILLAILCGASEARAQFACGQPAGQPILVNAGKWRYSWQVRSAPDPVVIYHGEMDLSGCNGYLSGSLGVADEVTDPFIRSTWSYPIMGVQNGSMTSLMTSNGPWFFQLVQQGLTYTISGNEFAGVEHNDRHATFSATYMGGQPNRAGGTGAFIPCPYSFSPLPNVSGAYSYNWNGGWHGTLTLNQSGAWLWGSYGIPNELAGDPWWSANWSWSFWGGMLVAPGVYSPNMSVLLLSTGGVVFGDPRWQVLPLTNAPPFGPWTFGTPFPMGADYATTCHAYEGTFSMVHQ